LSELRNALIAHNVDREQRQLAVWQYGSLDEEIAGVSNLVADLIGNREVPAGDILILAQRKVIGNPIFDNLRTAGIPVKSYYQEAEIDSSIAQERLALLKLLVNNEDRVALRWLIGLGSNDFRANAYRRIRSHCDHTGMSPWEALNALDEGELRIPHTASLIRRFREIQVELTRLSGIVDLEEFVEEWTPPDEPEVSQLRELALRSLDTCDTRETLLESVIQEISQPEIPLEVAEVRIMSLHKSKGLSSPIVIIAGCVDGVLPIEPNGNLPQAQRRALIEEQRRLFYVGITRVKADPDEGKPGRLYLTSSLTWPQRDALGAGASPARMRRGIAHFNASRFLGELGPAAPRPQRR
jgi:superfamily I DNA/RNA helicase